VSRGNTYETWKNGESPVSLELERKRAVHASAVVDFDMALVLDEPAHTYAFVFR
jgi:hypothetical protein